MKKTSKNNLLLVTAIFIGQHCYSQGFVNLDFEDATVIPVVPGIEASSAIPGWTAYYSVGFPLNTIFYNTVSLGGAIVALEDENAPGGVPLPIQGNYSVLLEGSIPNAATSAYIGQAGTIPITAQSLTFFGNLAGNIQVTFNGQNIPYSTVGNGANYTIYGADISSYAGQTGQLLFTAPVLTSALLDNIQFSPSPVPEPRAFALGALGALLLGMRRWRNSPSGSQS